MCRVFLEVPKKEFKGLLWTPHLQHMSESRPGSPGSTLEKTFCAGFFLSLFFLSCAEHRFPDFTRSRWQKGEIEQRKINGSELSEGPGKQGCTVVFQSR